MLRKLLKDTRGATAIEYSMIAATVSIAAIGAFLLLGQGTNRNFETVDKAYAEAQ